MGTNYEERLKEKHAIKDIGKLWVGGIRDVYSVRGTF